MKPDSDSRPVSVSPVGPVSRDEPTVASQRNTRSREAGGLDKTVASERRDPGTTNDPDSVGAFDRTVASAERTRAQPSADHPPTDAQARDAEIHGAGFIGRFAILRELGRGGMGQVFLAYDETLDRRVAIKLLTADASNRGADQRLVREAQAMAKLAHPNVAAVFEVGMYRGRVFVAMEYVAGQTLSDWLSAEDRSWRAVLVMFIQAGRGLSAAHRAGIVHRDFKPANVLVGDGRARVLDFGLARRVVPETGEDSPVEAVVSSPGAAPPSTREPLGVTRQASRDSWSESLTEYGAIMGTPLYMSPEQYRAEPADERSDQYSFCIALFEALYETSPFDTSSLDAHKEAKATGQIRTIKGLSSDLAELHTLITRGLATDAERRWTNMDQLLDALEDRVADHNQFLSSTHRWVFVGITLAIVALAGTMLLSVSEDGGLRPKHAVLTSGLSLLVFTAVVWFLRGYLRDSQLAMKIAVFLPATMALVFFHNVLAIPLERPLSDIFTINILILTSAFVVAGLTLHRLFWNASMFMAALTVGASLAPQYARFCMAAGTLALPIVVAIETWRAVRKEERAFKLRSWLEQSGLSTARSQRAHDASSSSN